MKLRMYKGIPYLYDEKTLQGSEGQALMCLVTIDPQYRHDKGLLAHEVRHVLHWWVCSILSVCAWFYVAQYVPIEYFFIGLVMCFFTYNGLTSTVPVIRYYAEIDCYVQHLKYCKTPEHYKQNLNYFAKQLSEKYDLKITVAQAKADLVSWRK